MTPEQFATVLGLTESEGKVRAWGDDTHGTAAPLAMGRFQIHPCWLWDHTLDDDDRPGELESWDRWICRLVKKFYSRWAGTLSPVVIAMWFHKGHRIDNSDSPDWDLEYAHRFIHNATIEGVD